jgi:thiol-disulfide isomerase/thioredoxin
LLAQSVVQEFGSKARFVVENYGDSALAKRFGVTRYPAIFADDVLVATPEDFGFYGKGEGGGEGRYAPLKSAASHERFRADLSRMIALILAGRTGDARAQAPAPEAPGLARLPAVALTDLDGRQVQPDDLAGRVVIVDFWATWCPPCRGTLTWLGEVKRRYGDRVVILPIAMESEESDVRSLATSLGLPLRWAIGSAAVARAFGDVSGFPTLFVFDGTGRSAGAYYGATPGLHASVEATLATIAR